MIGRLRTRRAVAAVAVAALAVVAGIVTVAAERGSARTVHPTIRAEAPCPAPAVTPPAVTPPVHRRGEGSHAAGVAAAPAGEAAAGGAAPAGGESPDAIMAARAVPAEVTVGAGGRPRPIPGSFLGISTEYWTLPMFERHGGLLARVLSLLHVRGDGRFVLRIGGDSADCTFWAPAGNPRPRWAFDLTRRWLARTALLVRTTGARVILDLNLITDTPPVAARLAGAAHRALPGGSILAFEIGNEPDLYTPAYFLSMMASRGVPTRLPAELSVGTYVREFIADDRLLGGFAPGTALAGPALAYPGVDLDWISTLLSAAPPRLRMLTAHIYPYSACESPGSPNYPTIARLLSEDATAGLGRLIRPAVRLARDAGIPLRLTELNSVTCGGVRGVSDTFATALWAPDALFELLEAGVGGVNVHVREDAINGAFALTSRGLIAHPLLYGLALFARTLGARARLLEDRVRAPRSVRLKAWAVRLAGGTVHVLLIDKGARATSVRVRLGSRLPAGAWATVQRLSAPSVRARGGIRLDGQRLGPDGLWRGPPAKETVAAGSHGYDVTVPGDSAALVSVPGPRS